MRGWRKGLIAARLASGIVVIFFAAVTSGCDGACGVAHQANDAKSEPDATATGLESIPEAGPATTPQGRSPGWVFGRTVGVRPQGGGANYLPRPYGGPTLAPGRFHGQ